MADKYNNYEQSNPDLSAEVVRNIMQMQADRDKSKPDSFGMTESDYKKTPEKYSPNGQPTGFLVEQSGHQDLIDEILFVQGETPYKANAILKEQGINISAKALASYKKRREKDAQNLLATHPAYAVYQQTVQRKVSDGLMQIRHIDVIDTLTNLIDDSATKLAEADRAGIVQIANVKDYREMQKTLLEAIKTYGEIMLMNQRFQLACEDPAFNRPEKTTNNTTINVNVQGALKDILKDAIANNDWESLDALREAVDVANIETVGDDDE